MKKIILLLGLVLVISGTFYSSLNTACADELSDSVEEQLDRVDFSEIEDFINGLSDEEKNSFFGNFYESVVNILNGNITIDYSHITQSLLNLFFDEIYEIIPSFISIIAIAIFCGLISNSRGGFLSQEIKDIVFFVCFLSVIMILITQTTLIVAMTKNTLNNLRNFITIMSPIILTFMAASGGTISVGIYRPAVAFLSNGIVQLMINIVLPFIIIMIIFSVVSNLSLSIKLNKFIDFFSGLIKWIVGLSLTFFAFFITVQGITASGFDGISLRATKYALSNSIPIIGGFLRDGVDFILAGSVMIKNAVGLSGILIVFFIILVPLINIVAFQLLLKLCSALVEPISDIRISNFCDSLSKSVNYLVVIILGVGFMIFVSVLLMICTANYVI